MKRKSKSQSRRLFVKKSNTYVKPTAGERLLVSAADAWKQVEPIGVADKPISKWTIKQTEEFIKTINQFGTITYDGGECGKLSELIQRTTSYLYDGMDQEMLDWLDPCYMVVDWTNTNIAPLNPMLTQVNPPVSAIVPIHPSGQFNTYMVDSITDGNFLLGLLVGRWPGIRGFTFNAPMPLELRH